MPPVILIGVDTLRADALGCYGSRKGLTPHIDFMARGGTLFSEISSQVPLTLPSFTSLFTSTYPFFNQVEENGEVVPSGAVTLAALLKSHGYRTAAFIGGFALDRRFGLDQGFDFYDSPFGTHQPFSGKRPGKLVVDAAIHWLDENSSHPFFLFLHLYDLHRPYLLAGASNSRCGYEVELKYVDNVLGDFWEYLARHGLIKKSLIVFTSDHGESLGEHGEVTHQYFIYQSTVAVPLIFHCPAASGRHLTSVDQPASLLDVAPTIMQFLHLPAPTQFQGRSLRGLSNGQAAERKVYSESVFARDHFGCTALRSLRVGRYKYIEAPRQELYDLEMDPHETRNLYARETSVAQSLRQQLFNLEAHFAPARRAPPTEPGRETRELLASLGYTELMYPRARPQGSGCDPKDRLAEYRLYGRAIAEAQKGNPRAAIQDFQKIIASDRNNAYCHYYLAVCYFRVRELDEAVRELQRTIDLSPYYSRAYELLGTIGLENDDYRRAEEEFRQLLRIAPGDYGANYNLGVLAMRQGQLQEAIHRFGTAVEADPQSSAAHNELGLACFRAGRLSQAQAEFERAISLRPEDAALHYNLGMTLQKLNRPAAAIRQFQKTLADDPNFLLARQALKRLATPH